jgi:hypothetical protein
LIALGWSNRTKQIRTQQNADFERDYRRRVTWP